MNTLLEIDFGNFQAKLKHLQSFQKALILKIIPMSLLSLQHHLVRCIWLPEVCH